MSVVGINFGSATSGNGFDVADTVSSIMSTMRAPENVWATQNTALQAQDAVLSTLGTDMAALSSALNDLTSFDGVLSQKTGGTSSSSVATLVSANYTASSGTHSLTVDQLATTSQQHTSAITSGSTMSGSIAILVGSNAPTTVSVSPGSSLMQVAAAINNSSAGVSATVINGSNGAYLSFTSKTGGASGEMSIDLSGLSDSAGDNLSMVTTQTGADASYTLDGIALTSNSNTISNVIPGITFQLQGTSSTPISMEIDNDADSIASAIGTFVSAYNTLASALSAQEGKDSSGKAQPLYGDQVISLIQSQLASALSFITGNSGASTNLAKMGISVGINGQLSLDMSALSNELTTNFTGVSNFFQNVGDFGQSMKDVLQNLGTGSSGALTLRMSQNTAQEKTLADNKTALEARLATYQTRLTAQLNIANEILQSIPQQLEQVKQIYAAISGYGQSGS